MKKFIAAMLSLASGFAVAGVGVKLWVWFLVPIGVPAVTLWHLLGLMLLVQMAFTGGLSDRSLKSALDKKNNVSPETQVAFAVTRALCALLILGIGYLYQLGV